MSAARLISVVITTYNAEPFVREAVESVLQQSAADLECLVIEDGSSDGTLAVLRTLRDPRLRVIDAGRIGRGRALNLGLRESRGAYVAIQDADDLAHPHRLATERALLERQPGYAALGTGALLLRPGERPRWAELGAHPPPLQDVSGEVLYLNPVCHSSLLVRRAALDAIGGYDARRSSQYDWDLLIRLVAAGQRIGRTAPPLVARRVHARQFFERTRRLHYVGEAYRLQHRARRELGRHWVHELAFFGLYAYRLLPHRLRLGWRHRRPPGAGAEAK